MIDNNWVRVAAITIVVIAAIVGTLQLSATTAEAGLCSPQYRSCLGWCAGEGRAIYGSFSSCSSACADMYCNI